MSSAANQTPSGKARESAGGELGGEARLAAPSGADERHQPVLVEELADPGDVVLARPTKLVRADAGWSASGSRSSPVGSLSVAPSSASSWPRMAASRRRSSSPGSRPELLGEHAAGLAERAECLRLSPRPVQREHQLAAESLPEGHHGDRRVEVGDQVGIATHRQQRLEPLLGDRHAELLEAARSGDRAGTSPNSGRARPRHWSRASSKQSTPTERCAPRPALPDLGDEPFEPVGVDVVGERQHVAGRTCLDQLRTERAAQLEHDELERVVGCCGGRSATARRSATRTARPPGIEGQEGQQCAAGVRDGDRLPALSTTSSGPSRRTFTVAASHRRTGGQLGASDQTGRRSTIYWWTFHETICLASSLGDAIDSGSRSLR